MQHTGFEIALERLEINRFRSFSTLDVDFTLPDAVEEEDPIFKNVTVFISSNGGGKSTILDVIAEHLKILLNFTFFRQDNYISQLNASDVRQDSLNSTCKALLLLSWRLPISNEDKTDDNNSDTEDINPGTPILVNFNLEKTNGSFTTNLSEHLQDEDLIVKHFYDRTKYIDDTYHLPVLAYFGDRSSINSRFEEENMNIPDIRLRTVYSGALEPTRFDMMRFFNWYNIRQKVRLEMDVFSAIAGLEEVVEKMKIRQNLQQSLDEPYELLETVLKNIKENSIENSISLQLKFMNEAILEMLSVEGQKFSNLRIEIKNKSEKLLIAKGDIPDLEINQLSAGEKNLFALVADLTMRLIEANPFEEETPNPFHGTGIVLIDEIDLHLHPRWQRMVLPKLMDLFPNIQFIITTHSPFVLQAVKPEQVEIFSIFNQSIQKESSFHFGRYLEDILYEYFNLTPRPKEIDDLNLKIYKLLNRNEISEAKRLFEILKKFLSEEDPAILDLTNHPKLIEK